jgi:hypothetical protein
MKILKVPRIIAYNNREIFQKMSEHENEYDELCDQMK